MREEVLRKHLPHVPFVDHSPQQLPHDEETDVPPEELLRGLPKCEDGSGGEGQRPVDGQVVGEVAVGGIGQENGDNQQQEPFIATGSPNEYSVEAY